MTKFKNDLIKLINNYILGKHCFRDGNGYLWWVFLSLGGTGSDFVSTGLLVGKSCTQRVCGLSLVFLT
jgi:hypothetical protein